MCVPPPKYPHSPRLFRQCLPVWLSVILCCLFPLNAAAELRALTVNAEWLWTPFDSKVDGSLSSNRDMSVAAYSEELAFYADLTQSRNIAVLAINEIENEQVARELADKLGKDWRYFFRQGRDTATGQDVAILSRLPYIEGSLTDFDFPSARLGTTDKPKKVTKLVGAQFWLESAGKKQKLGVITAHLLSKRNENKHKAENRQKQALALRQAIRKFSGETDKLLVLGDFNDQINSATMTILLDTPLNSYQHCDNFKAADAEMKLKKWRRHIDHILFSGLVCLSQEKIDLKHYSDHDAILGVFTLSR
jgi:endonuclease/exonuclease/phosphatase (EEP) superfamily protein YafD